MSQYLSHICVFRLSLNILLYIAFRIDQISLLFFFFLSTLCDSCAFLKDLFYSIHCLFSQWFFIVSVLHIRFPQLSSDSWFCVHSWELRTWKSNRISVRLGRALDRNISIRLIWLGLWLKISENHYLINFLKRKCHWLPRTWGWGCLNLLRGAEHTDAGPSQFSMCRFPLRSLLSSCITTISCVYCLQQDAFANSPESKPPAWMHQTRKFQLQLYPHCQY